MTLRVIDTMYDPKLNLNILPYTENLMFSTITGDFSHSRVTLRIALIYKSTVETQAHQSKKRKATCTYILSLTMQISQVHCLRTFMPSTHCLSPESSRAQGIYPHLLLLFLSHQLLTKKKKCKMPREGK